MKENEGKSETGTKDENSPERIRYPKVVILILGNEFCERFSYYGMRAILSLYLRNHLHYRESDAKMIFHGFVMFAYFFPLFGAILADSFIGRFKTILYISMIYISGNAVLAVSSIDPLHLPQVAMCLLALFLIAVGTGGIKPCVQTFGGDQFVLPQQEKQLIAFFAFFYFSINVGSFISTIVTPILRKGVNCFGENTCYPLAFGFPGMLMILATILFLIGRPFYAITKPKGNIMAQVFKCIGFGVKQKIKSREKVDHWLDRCEDKYGKTLVKEIKRTFSILTVFIPMPMFWALFDQQGSGWTFQASRMNGEVGSFTILPDQVQTLNSIMITMLIPIFTYGIYPCLGKCNLLKRPLQRMSVGGFLAACSFFVAAGLSFAVEAQNPVKPSNGECQIRIYNLLDCHATITAKPYFHDKKINSMGYTKIDLKNVKKTNVVNFTITGCDNINYASGVGFNVTEKATILYYMTSNKLVQLEDDITKHQYGFPKIRILVNESRQNLNMTFWKNNLKILDILSTDTALHEIDPDIYKINKFNKELTFKLGAVYTILVSLKDNNKIKKIEIYEITKANTLHVLLQVPQYFVISVGEILFSITANEFAYTQAPYSMKAILSAANLLTTACGNLIVLVIESTKLFERESLNFIVYGCLMVLDMLLFSYLAYRYKYVNLAEAAEDYANQQRERTQ